MALRSPIYLDVETLLSQAEYYEIEVPRQADIVERTTRKRSGQGKVNVPGLGGAGAATGSDVETQATYKLEPREKALVSKVIDSLIADGSVNLNMDSDSVISRDDLVEIEGTTRITAASMAGKMFFILRRLLEDADINLEDVTDLDIGDLPVGNQLKAVYLRNELLPIPLLLELTRTSLEQKVYVNLRPDHFIDAASANRVENDFRVLGSVSRLVPDGEEGYFSAEYWLLHDWEHLLRRQMMTQVEDLVRDVVAELDLNLPAEDVHSIIKGPAIIVDAIAVY